MTVRGKAERDTRLCQDVEGAAMDNGKSGSGDFFATFYSVIFASSSVCTGLSMFSNVVYGSEGGGRRWLLFPDSHMHSSFFFPKKNKKLGGAS